MRNRSRTSRLCKPTTGARTAPVAGPCGACTRDCAGCVFAERAAEARAEGDDAAVRRSLDQMARRGCRRLQVTAKSRRGFGQRLVTGAAAAALVLSLGLAGCETDAGGKTDTFGTDTHEVYEVAILPADVVGGDGIGEIYAILPPDADGETDHPEVYPVMPPECTTDDDCTEQFYGCVDGRCEQVMFPVMPQCQANDDCKPNEACVDGACQPVVSILPACSTNDDCKPHEACVNGACQPMISILPACTTNDDCQPSEVCDEGYCLPVVSILPACTSDDDCATPIEACVEGQCEQVMWPIMPQCQANEDCAVGEVCVNNTCQPVEPVACSADADCPDGQICVGECPAEDGSVFCILPVKGQCVTPPLTCQSNDDCAPGEVCDKSSGCPDGMYCILPQNGTCVPKVNPPTCTSDDDCVPGDVCVGGCPEGMYCILPKPSTCQTECATDDDCEANETCVGASTCPADHICILPDQKGVCEPGMFAILPPSPKPIAPPVTTGDAGWRGYVEGALAWFRPDSTKTGRS